MADGKAARRIGRLGTLCAATFVVAACSSAMAGPRVAPLAPTVTPGAVASATSARGRVVVDVTGLHSDKGLVGVAIFCGPEGFPGDSGRACARARVAIVNRTAYAVFDALPAGAFAVSVLHDEDQDGRLGTNWAGIPAEGYGASRGARRRFGAPRWNDARLSLAGGEEKRVVVEVGY